jgi:hypothetical protein
VNWRLLLGTVPPPLLIALGIRFTAFGPEISDHEAWAWSWMTFLGGGLAWMCLIATALDNVKEPTRVYRTVRHNGRLQTREVLFRGDDYE